MSLFTEFKVSLKTVEAEEIFDLVVFRPISFILVKLIYSTEITPNQISVAAMIFGILSGIFYGYGTYEFFLIASASFFLCNTLDCADGQLARLKRNGTKIGRVVDGFIDYITSISVFLGLGSALTVITGNAWSAWTLTVLAGFSKAVQNMYFDRFRNMYMEYVYNKASSIDEEIVEFTAEKERMLREGSSFVTRIMVNSYLFYCKIQKPKDSKKLNISPAEYKKKNKFLLRLWSWIGSTTHLVVLIIFAVFNRVDLYLVATVILGNFIFIILFIWQKSVLRGISAGSTQNKIN